MYRRYQPSVPPKQNCQNSSQPHQQKSAQSGKNPCMNEATSKPKHPQQTQRQQGQCSNKGQSQNKNSCPPHPNADIKNNERHPLTKFIPQSVYNPETGKVFGFLSADDLLIAALILLLIDNNCDDEDNSMLIWALLYILISEHIDLPL